MNLPTSHIFFTQEQSRQILENTASTLNKYCDLYQKRMAEISDPGASLGKLWAYMPPPAYDHTYGIKIDKGETYQPSFGESSDFSFLLDLSQDRMATVFVKLDENHIVKLRRHRKRLRAICGRRSGDLKTLEINLTARRIDDEWVVAIEGEIIAQFTAPANRLAPEISVQRGHIFLVMAQSLAPRASFIFFDTDQGDRTEKLERERNAYRFKWGLRSIRLNACFIIAATLRDLANTLRQSGDIRCEQALQTRILDLDMRYADVLERFLMSYMAWPRWRPGVGDFPENGPWDRNSFSNGVIPFSVALLARLCPDVAPPQTVQESIERKASDFYQAGERMKFLRSSRGRNTSWWTKRSANHGLIMMFSYLAAAEIAKLSESPGAAIIRKIAVETFEHHYADGSFCEGVHYSSFTLALCLPYFHLIKNRATAPQTSFSTLLPLVYEWWALSHDGAGNIFANFGDNVSRQSSPDRVSVGRYLRNHATIDLAEGIDHTRVDSYMPFALLDHADPPKAAGLIHRLYPENQFAHAAYFTPDGRRTNGLFVIGSVMQLTHNKNHDTGGFAFYANGWRIGIEQASRQPGPNNGVSFLDPQGGVATIEGARDYDGRVSVLSSAEAETLIFESSIQTAQVQLAGGATARFHLKRRFTYRPTHEHLLIIDTEFDSPDRLQPRLNFNLIHETSAPPPSLTCSFLDEDGAWRPAQTRATGTLLEFTPPSRRRPRVNFRTWIGRPKNDGDLS